MAETTVSPSYPDTVSPSFPDIENPVLRDFFGTWMDKYLDGASCWGSVQLEVFGQHVRHMDQHGYCQTEDRFQSNFVGTGTVAATGFDITGKFLDELPNSQLALKRFRRMLETREPYLTTGLKVRRGPNIHRIYDVLACPLFDNTGRVSGVVCRTDFAHNDSQST